jgi:hypothetical protein
MPSHLETRGMLLSLSFESDLSHTSILYYYDIRKMKIFEYWSQGVSENKEGNLFLDLMYNVSTTIF